jgi:FtsP/CotA-like multicopper oxidase with cupredoxin domain
MTTAPGSLSSFTTRAPREIHVDLEARETAWEIAPGRTVSAWGYQGSVPGPAIVAHVGDTIVAHLVNNLPEPTVIHWHGLRLPRRRTAPSPAAPRAAGRAIQCRFELPGAGTFWYHSRNETVRVSDGLARARRPRSGEPAFDADRLLVFDDVKIDRHGRIANGAHRSHSGREGRCS